MLKNIWYNDRFILRWNNSCFYSFNKSDNKLVSVYVYSSLLAVHYNVFYTVYNVQIHIKKYT